MKNYKLFQIKISLILVFCISGRLLGQQNINDSLELIPLITRVIHTFPTVQQATETLNAAEIRIAIARSAYLPNAQFTGSFAHIGPVPSLTLPDVGSFSLAPANNVNAAIGVNQTLYDFGKTKKNIEYEEKGKELSSLGINQIKQRISLAVIGCYYNLLFYQEAVTIKEEQILTLKEHLRHVEKKIETGSSTQYEVLSTKVRLSSVESQKVDVLTSMNIHNSYLNMLLGEPATTQHHVRNLLVSDAIPYSNDSLVSLALQNRNEVKIAEKKVMVSKVYMDLIKTHEKPVISAFASGGWKNGYIPQLDKPKANYAVGLSLLIPIYDATRTNLNTRLAGSSVSNNIFELDLAKRTITNEIMENINTLKSAISKAELFKMQLSQAKKALELAELRFKSGTLTNLDLLDAENAVSESSLLYLKARIDRVVVDYKLKAALGVNLYTEN